MTRPIGKDSLYAISLQLVAIGGLSFIPWSRRYFVMATLLVYLPYYAVELGRVTDGVDQNRLLVNSFFIVGIISITWVIHVYREQLRWRELTMRLDLEKEVAQRKQTEQALIVARDEALAATHAKEAFLANMSHEIRTPLTAIIGFAEHAQDQEVSDSERRSALNTIMVSSHHLLNIINDILDFSKIEADSIELEKIDMDPVQLAAEVQSLMMPLSMKKGLPINVVYEFPLPTRIVSDPVRIRQILINLCSNAIKFSEQGAITLTLAFDKDNNRMIFRVRDKGIGMTAEQLERVFVPFKQADSSITRRYGGTGLGLSLSRKLALLLEGELAVESQKDIGSEFRLAVSAGDRDKLLFVESLDQLNQEQQDEPQNPAISRLAGNVLLAEDNENNQRLLTIYLNKMGLKVTTADNGAAAVEQSLNHPFDLILMDMQMPVLSGLDAVRQLRSRGITTPVIALTANATSQDRQKCLEAGCQDFLTKPVTRERLYQVLAKHLDQSATRPAAIAPLYSELTDEEPEIVEVINRFITKLPVQIATINAAFYANDWATFRDCVHDLKGMGGGFGFPQLSQLAAKIETLFKQQDYAAIVPVISELNLLLQRIDAGLSPSS